MCFVAQVVRLLARVLTWLQEQYGVDRGLMDNADDELAHVGAVVSEARSGSASTTKGGAWMSKLSEFAGGVMNSVKGQSAKLIRNVAG
jgi:hypothetical protein